MQSVVTIILALAILGFCAGAQAGNPLALLPAPPSPWSITEWPAPEQLGQQPEQPDQHPGTHVAPSEFMPYNSSDRLQLSLVNSTRAWLTNPDIWPTYVVSQDDQNWIDSTRDYLHEKATGPVVWFDNFFALKRGDTSESASHDLRITPKISCRNLDGCKQNIRVRSRVTLPHTEQRLRLLLTNEDPDTVYDTLDRYQALPDERTNNPFSAALSYALKITDSYDIRLSSGVQGGGTPQAFLQAGTSGRVELNPNLLMSAGQSIFYRTHDGWGARTQLDFDAGLRDQVNEVIRVRQRLDVSQEFIGADYDASVEYLYQINRNRAWGLGAGASLNNRRDFDDEGYRAWYRFRKRFYREWLFWEIQPFVAWTRSQSFRADPGLALSIEIYLDEDS